MEKISHIHPADLPPKNRVQVINPPIYLISVLPALAVYLLAGKETLWLTGLLIATLGVVLLQHAINLFNDVTDWERGADINKMNSWVRFYDGDTRPVQQQAIVSFSAGAILGVVALYLSDQLWVMFMAMPLVGLGYLYNAGKSPLSYTSLGEWVTGLCYGGVFVGYWLVAGLPWNWPLFFGALAIAALSMSLLLSHQSPQLETDRQVGKQSFCVRYGVEITEQVSILLFILAMMFILTGCILQPASSALWYGVIVPIACCSYFLFKHKPDPKRILILSSMLLLLMVLMVLFLNSQVVNSG